MSRVVTVVVTWNRLQMLQECLAAVLGQSHPPAKVIVVDNASSDGTRQWLAETYADDDRVTVLTMRSNVGGAGGFTAGMADALGESPDALWLLDDDALPSTDALKELVRVWQTYPGLQSPSVVASRILWTDGRDQPANTPRRRRTNRRQQQFAADVQAMPIRTASFVSVLIDANCVRRWGLPIADYFLWNDDLEYTARILRDEVGLYCPASEVVHRTAKFYEATADPGERFYFEVRNKMWFFARSRSLHFTERLLFAGSTAVRWSRLWWASTSRKTLWSSGWRGVRDGFIRPQPNAEVLRHARLERLSTEPAAFSLLMSTWAGDNADWLRLAIESATIQQTRMPDELVLVQDGPVSDDVAELISEIHEALPIPVRHIVLTENMGLGPALQIGLNACRHEIVARMDSDDISLPHRFTKQVPMIEEGADIVGAWLLEFGDNVNQIVGQRKQPLAHAPIHRVMRFRDPFNHPTVIYRRSSVIASGGYPDLRLMEDYLLFARMLHDGATAANVGEPLVLYRVGKGAYVRRGGLGLLRSELRLQRQFRHLGITSPLSYLRNVTLRGGYRLAPLSLRRIAYRRLFRSAEAPPTPSIGSPHAP